MLAFYSLRRLRSWWVALFLTACVASKPVQAQLPTKSFKIQVAVPNFRVSGDALDARTRQPVSGIGISGGWGTVLTDVRGHFVLRLPNSLRQHPERVFVVSLLYEAQAPLPTDTAQRVTLLLRRNSFRFNPYGCQVPNDSVHMAPYSRPWDGLPGTQQAFLFQDSSIHQPRKLRAVTFRIGKNGFVREPFTVIIYRYNGPEQPPGEVLMTRSYQIMAPTEGLFSFDLSNYNAIMPAGGFFLALEYATGSDGFYPHPYMVGHVPTGPVLRAPCAFADTRTWLYEIGKGWQRIPPAQKCWPLYESAVGVEVTPAH